VTSAHRVVLHVDMDAFFAAVEVKDEPGLAGRPLIVGGDGPRGVVASCSYEARRYGIRSAMPSVQARRLCPRAVFRPGRYERYREVSEAIHEVFHHYTPLVEGIALDEAFLDVTGARRSLGPGPVIAARLRTDIEAAVGLQCSVGVAPSKFLAKLASEAAKPRADRDGIHPGRGVVVVEPGGELEFLRPLAVEALWGVGPATAARLRAIGITTVGRLGDTPLAVLESAVGRANGRHLHDLANARDPRPVEPDRATKSIGHEETYTVDRYDADGLHREIVRMADAVAGRLRAAGLTARTVQLKVRWGDFRTLTRSRTVGRPLRDGPSIAGMAASLFDALDLEGGVRLLGVSVASLEVAAAATQLELGLDGAAPDRRDAAAGAVDAVRSRFGEGAVGPGSLVTAAGLQVGRHGDNRWAPVTPDKPPSPADRDPGALP
jgi:DNA polymerase-4